MNIGNPIAATDPDSDTLTYSLRGVDAGSFDIVAESGRLQTKAALDYETRNSYTVTVSVHDGKADDGSPNEEPDDTITVTITVTDEDEPPGKPDAPTVGPASTNGHNTLTVTWTAPANTGPAITGYDVEYRKQGAEGWLTNNVTVSGATITGALPDTNYEARVRAKNDEGTGEWSEPGTGRSGTTPPAQQKNLTVSYQPAAYTVNEGGSGSVTVTLDSASDRALQVPITITAGTAETGDYQVSGLSGGALAFATGASSASFTVEAVQDTDTSNETLTLGFGQLPGKVTEGTHSTAGITINDDDPPAVNNPPSSRRGGSIGGSGSIVNQAPVFTEGGSAARVVAENAAAGTNIGAPIAATDADKDPIAYTLKGVDRAYFALNNGSGQLSTRDTLDFEVKSRYSVSLLATDAKGGSDSIIVTITVTDVDEVPITNPGTQVFALAAQPDAQAPTPTPEPTPTIIPATAAETVEGPIIPPVVSAGPVAPVEETGGFPWWLLLLIAVAVTITAAGIYAMRRRRKAAAVPVVDPAEEDASEVPPFQVTPPVAVTTPARTAPALAPSPEATPALEAPPRYAYRVALGRDLVIPTRRRRRPFRW